MQKQARVAVVQVEAIVGFDLVEPIDHGIAMHVHKFGCPLHAAIKVKVDLQKAEIVGSVLLVGAAEPAHEVRRRGVLREELGGVGVGVNQVAGEIAIESENAVEIRFARLQREILREVLLAVFQGDICFHASHVAVLEQVETRGKPHLRLETGNHLEEFVFHGGNLFRASLCRDHQHVDALVGYHGAARLEPRANLMRDVRDATALFGACNYRYLEHPFGWQVEQAGLLIEIVGIVDVVIHYRRKKRRSLVPRGEGRLPELVEAGADSVGEQVEEELFPGLDRLRRHHDEMCGVVPP